MANLRYAPEFRIAIRDTPVPAALRGSISSVLLQTGLEGSDRVELVLGNESLRWLDNPLLALDSKLTLWMGYAPDPLDQVFVGQIVALEASFPSSGMPTLTVVAQDLRQKLQNGNKVRWFAASVPTLGNFPIPDTAVSSMVTLENFLIPLLDPIGAALSVLLGGAQVALNLSDPKGMQMIIRKQVGESDYDFLARIALENGWEMLIDHTGPKGGYQLRFLSPEAHLAPDVTLKYGQSLIDFTPRITNVGQIKAVAVSIWQPDLKMDFTISASWDWDRQALDVSISPGFGLPGTVGKTLDTSTTSPATTSSTSPDSAVTLVEEPVTRANAPRVILGKLIPQLNRRLTGSGSTIGDTRIQAGKVLRLEGLGQTFSGLFRVTSATHSLDSSGYRTSFDARKEIWFGSIPLPQQGAVPTQLQF
jgi:phage protein D